MEKFLGSWKETDKRWKDLWMRILEWWKTQHRYSTNKEFADSIGWDTQSLNSHLQNGQAQIKGHVSVLEKLPDNRFVNILLIGVE